MVYITCWSNKTSDYKVFKMSGGPDLTEAKMDVIVKLVWGSEWRYVSSYSEED